MIIHEGREETFLRQICIERERDPLEKDQRTSSSHWLDRRVTNHQSVAKNWSRSVAGRICRSRDKRDEWRGEEVPNEQRHRTSRSDPPDADWTTDVEQKWHFVETLAERWSWDHEEWEVRWDDRHWSEKEVRFHSHRGKLPRSRWTSPCSLNQTRPNIRVSTKRRTFFKIHTKRETNSKWSSLCPIERLGKSNSSIIGTNSISFSIDKADVARVSNDINTDVVFMLNCCPTVECRIDQHRERSFVIAEVHWPPFQSVQQSLHPAVKKIVRWEDCS